MQSTTTVPMDAGPPDCLPVYVSQPAITKKASTASVSIDDIHDKFEIIIEHKNDTKAISDKVNHLIIKEQGEIINCSNDYGIGIDCHSKFIAVSVIVQIKDQLIEFHRNFETTLDELELSKQWVIGILEKKADPPVTFKSSTEFHYCIESTASYWFPVILKWKGVPSVVNPSIAGSAKKKTDRLDSRLLSVFDLNSIWKSSYIPEEHIQILRIIIDRRSAFTKEATRIASQINNTVLRFGVTLGRDGSLVKSAVLRSIIESLISDSPSEEAIALFPDGIPPAIHPLIREMYDRYDKLQSQIKEYDGLLYEYVCRFDWETESGALSGKEMIDLLITAPGIAVHTAIVWLAYIVTPLRFPNAKAISAYCGLDPSLKTSADKITSTVKRGGNKDLHKALCNSANIVMRNHNEPFGQWGYRLYQNSDRWKKGTNAVARKLCVSLYHMQLRGVPFSYDQYKIATPPDVPDMTLETLSIINHKFRRYISILKQSHIQTTKQLAKAYTECTLRDVKGLGKSFFSLVRDFIDNEKKLPQRVRSFYKQSVV